MIVTIENIKQFGIITNSTHTCTHTYIIWYSRLAATCTSILLRAMSLQHYLKVAKWTQRVEVIIITPNYVLSNDIAREQLQQRIIQYIHNWTCLEITYRNIQTPVSQWICTYVVLSLVVAMISVRIGIWISLIHVWHQCSIVNYVFNSLR